MFGAETHVGICGEMKHQLGALHRLRQALAVEQVGFFKRELRMSDCSFQKSPLPSREIVEPDDAVTCGEQPINHVTANEPSRPSNQNAQELPPYVSSLSLRPSRILSALCGSRLPLLLSTIRRSLPQRDSRPL